MRTNKPLMITLPPDELDRLRAFAGRCGRPVSWIVRDAVTAYLEAVETNTAALAAVRIDTQTIGKTTQTKLGRPAGMKKKRVKG